MEDLKIYTIDELYKAILPSDRKGFWRTRRGRLEFVKPDPEAKQRVTKWFTPKKANASLGSGEEVALYRTRRGKSKVNPKL